METPSTCNHDDSVPSDALLQNEHASRIKPLLLINFDHGIGRAESFQGVQGIREPLRPYRA